MWPKNWIPSTHSCTCTVVMVQFGWCLFCLPSQSVGTHLSRRVQKPPILVVESVSLLTRPIKEKTFIHVHVAIMTQGEHRQCGKWRKLNKFGMAIPNSLYLPCCSVPPVYVWGHLDLHLALDCEMFFLWINQFNLATKTCRGVYTQLSPVKLYLCHSVLSDCFILLRPCHAGFLVSYTDTV